MSPVWRKRRSTKRSLGAKRRPPVRKEHPMTETVQLGPPDRYNEALLHNVHPPDWVNPEPPPRYNLVVIGAGTAGFIIAAGGGGGWARSALNGGGNMGGGGPESGGGAREAPLHGP